MTTRLPGSFAAAWLAAALGVAGVTGVAGITSLACLEGEAWARLSVEQKRTARIHFEAGEQHYLRGRYEEAIREFQEAYRLTGAPALLYNLAQAYERRGDLRRAREHLQGYLEAGEPAPEERAFLTDKVTSLDLRIAEEEAARAAKGEPRAGEPKATGAAGAEADKATDPGSNAASDGNPSGDRHRRWKWIAAASGGALILVAGGFAIDAARMESRIEDAQDPTRAWALQSSYDRGARDEKIAWVTGGLGLASLAAGAVLFYLDRHDDEEPPPASSHPSITPLASPSTVGATIGWKW